MSSSCIQWIKWCRQTLFLGSSTSLARWLPATSKERKGIFAHRCGKSNMGRSCFILSHMWVSLWTSLWSLGGRALSLAKPKSYVHSKIPAQREETAHPDHVNWISPGCWVGKKWHTSSNFFYKYKFLRVTSGLKKMKVCDNILKDCILLNGLSADYPSFIQPLIRVLSWGNRTHIDTSMRSLGRKIMPLK